VVGAGSVPHLRGTPRGVVDEGAPWIRVSDSAASGMTPVVDEASHQGLPGDTAGVAGSRVGAARLGERRGGTALPARWATGSVAELVTALQQALPDPQERRRRRKPASDVADPVPCGPTTDN